MSGTKLTHWTGAAMATLAQLKRHVATLESISEITDAENKLDALRKYAEESDASVDTVNALTAGCALCQERAGEILQEMKKHKGGRPGKTAMADMAVSEVPSYQELLGGTVAAAQQKAANWQLLAAADLDIQGMQETATQKGEQLTLKDIYKAADRAVNGEKQQKEYEAVDLIRRSAKYTAKAIESLLAAQEKGAKVREALALARQLDGWYRAWAQR